jgi:hypothetical protein
MSVEHLATVLHHSRAKGTAKLVLLGIANHQGDGGAWPSVATLARYANVDARSVQRAVSKLVSTGELLVHIQGGGGLDMENHDRPNRYEVLVSCPPWCDHTPQHRDMRRYAGPQLGIRLGIEGVTPVSPGDASVTPPGDASVTRTTTINPDLPSVVSQPQTAREAGPACAECLQPRHICEARQVKLHPEDRHRYATR